MTDELLLFNKLFEHLLKNEQEKPVAQIVLPKNALEQLPISLSKSGIDDDELATTLKQILEATPKTASNKFFNQLFGGRQPKAVLGDLLAVALNNSMYTYKVAGPQVLLEKEVINQLLKLVHFDAENAGGTFAAGGSTTNLMSMLMARDQHDLSIKENGISNRLIAYTSDVSHYSVVKNASFIGIGNKQVRKVQSDEHGKMRIDALEEMILADIKKGHQPFYVNATAGTTVFGAFDNIEAISKICKKHGLWLHVDGAYCGSVILSEKYKHLVKGCSKADSFSLNGHKMLGTPLTCSIILVANKQHLVTSFSAEASYLYQSAEDEYNPGKISMQCGRRNDALKLWVLWKSIGTAGLEKMVDKQFYLADYAREYIYKHPDYKHCGIDDSISVCFNYKDIPAPKICSELNENGQLMIGHGSHNEEVFVRLTTINATNTTKEIDNFFAEIESN